MQDAQQGQQLALLLFDSLAPQGAGVDKAPSALGFRRSNAFVQIVDLSLAGRRLIDVAYFLASAESEIQPIYSVDYGLFKWLLGTTSDNRAHIKRLIREAQKAAIELNGHADTEDSNQDWAAVPLMGKAGIKNGHVHFELDTTLQRVIKNPAETHFLSLRYVFKSLYSKILYDRLQPYLDNGSTPWFDVQQLRTWMECDKVKSYDVFKYFRSKVIDKALNEVREIAGLNVEMVTQNVPGSKKIGQVRFRWDVTNKSDEQKIAMVVLKSTYETLKSEFGLSQTEIDEIIRNREIFNDDRLQQAMAYTRHQHSAGKIKIRVGGYFMKSLREDYRIGILDQQIATQKTALANSSAASTKTKQDREEKQNTDFTNKQKKDSAAGWKAFQELSKADQDDLATAFSRLSTSASLAKRLCVEPSALPGHLQNPLVEMSFGCYVANALTKRGTPKT